MNSNPNSFRNFIFYPLAVDYEVSLNSIDLHIVISYQTKVWIRTQPQEDLFFNFRPYQVIWAK